MAPVGGQEEWLLEVVDINGTSPFQAFMKSLNDHQLIIVEAALEIVLKRRGPDVCQTEWGKPVGDGVYEFRIRRGVSEIYRSMDQEPPEDVADGPNPLLRVFFACDKGRVLLLLGGFDKLKNNKSRNQNQQIQQAKELLKGYRRERRLQAKRKPKGQS